MSYSTKKNIKNKGPSPISKVSKMRKSDLTHWAKSSLIIPLSAYMGLRLNWVPKSNKKSLLQETGGSGNHW